MPSESEHLNKAEYNERYYLSFDLDSTPYLDWVVNGIFYSAVHYIETYLAIKGKHPTSHGERNADIRDDENLGRDIFKKFISLKDDSEAGRYYMQNFTPRDIRQYIIPQVDDIKQYLKKYVPQIRLA
ncbi:MAG: hypothetical protein FJ126_03810 [Deltaproteobacteria bacterium]|nr:hypothetical protein [Deltaproteobacteria bacterium]